MLEYLQKHYRINKTGSESIYGKLTKYVVFNDKYKVNWNNKGYIFYNLETENIYYMGFNLQRCKNIIKEKVND